MRMELIQRAGSKIALLQSTPEALKQYGAKASEIKQITELREAVREYLTPETPVQIKSSVDAFKLVQHTSLLHIEKFTVIYCRKNNTVICTEELSVGGMTGTVVDRRLIFKRALELNACAIILSHNHPSGNVSPSQQDNDITKKIKEAGAIMDIQLLDHVIVAGTIAYYSYADEGQL